MGVRALDARIRRSRCSWSPLMGSKYRGLGVIVLPVKHLVCNRNFLALSIIFCGVLLREDLILGRQ